MGRLQYTAWLAEQSFSSLVYCWPVTLILAVGCLVTAVVKSPFRPFQFRARHSLILAPLLVSLLILVWGAVMEHPSDSQSLAPTWPSYVVLALVVAQLLTGIYVVCVMKGNRWFSAFAVALEQWFGLACAFVAGMSVTGDWL